MHTPTNQLRFGLYARKSTIGEDRQVLSIDSQLDVLQELARTDGLKVSKVYQDCASAHKVANRPQFDLLMKDLATGKIDAILCWKFDRLARNMVEGGLVIDALQHHRIKAIVTPAKRVWPTDNMLILAVELGMANQFSLDLAVNVKRGMKTKAEKGGLNSRSPLGYVNDRLNKTVVKDPERYELVRKLWDFILTGRYSLNALCQLSAKEWGLRTRQGKPLSITTLYRMFTNPFYYGAIRLHGEVVADGQHQPMITVAEFSAVKQILQRHGYQTNRIASYDFAYRGLLRCGSCDSGITVEEKRKYFCPSCRCPQTAKNPHDCKRCGHSFSKKAIEKSRRYTYYRCTKKNPRIACDEKCLREELLQDQLIKKLGCINLDQDFANWMIDSMDALDQVDDKGNDSILASLSKQITALEARKQRLLDLRLADEISKDEFSSQKAKIEPEHAQVCTQFYNLKHRVHTWKPRFKKDVQLCLDLSACLAGNDLEAKKAALSDLGSNLTLKGREVTVDLPFPFLKIAELKQGFSQRLEPLPSIDIASNSGGSDGGVCVWSTVLKEIRTWYMFNH